MCNVAPDIMDKLTATVEQFLNEGRMFTGYDVTIETRNREKMMLRHDDVRGGIHEIELLNDAIEFGYDGPRGGTTKWEKSQKTMPNGTWAFVYHPQGLDPNQYQPRNTPSRQSTAAPASLGKSALSLPVPKPAGLSISTVNDGVICDSGGEQDDGTFATDHRERLMIPTRYMKEAGLTPGDQCFVITEPASNTVIITKEDPALKSLSFTVQKVERDGELRLSSKTLRAADLTDNKFVIETTDKTLAGNNVKVVMVKKSDLA